MYDSHYSETRPSTQVPPSRAQRKPNEGLAKTNVSLRSLTFDGDIDFSVRIPALVDPEKKESIRQAVTEKYLAQFPQYKDSFAVYFVRSDEGARFES